MPSLSKLKKILDDQNINYLFGINVSFKLPHFTAWTSLQRVNWNGLQFEFNNCFVGVAQHGSIYITYGSFGLN